MVAVFLAFVAVIALATSFHGQMVRGQIGRSHHGYELVELCDSAIDEAGGQLALRDVFPQSPFGNFKAFLLGVSLEDEAAVNAAVPGYKPFFGDVIDPISRQSKGKVFLSLGWPQSFQIVKQVPEAEKMAARLPGFKGPLGPVTGRVLAWRRDLVARRWQNWGVVQWKVTASMSDGSRTIGRTMYVDRMFSLVVDYDPAGLAGMPPVVKDLYITWLRSNRNLRTVIERG